MFKKFLSAIAIVIIGFLSVTFFSCKKDKENDTVTSEFDRKAMLENIGNNIIIPAYHALKSEVEQMDSAVASFIAFPDLTNLVSLQNAYKDACLSWQNVSTFEFGTAEQLLLRANVNTFPTDTAQIKSNIGSGSYDLASAANIDAKGFPAIDYLLFGIGADNNAILDKYVSDIDASKRKIYLQDINNEIKANVNNVYNSWIADDGNYINTFINNTGTNVGSSLGLLVNQLNYDFEILKNYRIGIPLGKKTLGVALPEKVEAYYARNSVQLAVEHIKAIENIYLGRNKQGNDELGLDDYLTYLKSQYNGGLLSDTIKAQLTAAINKLQNIPDPLSETVINNPSIVDAAYIELQKQVVLFKTDMPSSLGVLITYQDNDGD